MQVFVVFDEAKAELILGGRTPPPISFDFKRTLKQGEIAFGMSFDELKQLSGFETDPEGGTKVVKTTPRRVPSLDVGTLDDNPAWLIKQGKS